MEQAIKVGMEVLATEEYQNNIKGRKGIVVGTDGISRVTVEFYHKLINGHAGCGKGKQGYCWNVPIRMLEIVNNPLLNLEQELKELFKQKHVSILKNGNTLKLAKRDGRVVCMYNIGTKTRMNITTPMQVENEYVNLFNHAINKYEEIEKETKIC